MTPRAPKVSGQMWVGSLKRDQKDGNSQIKLTRHSGFVTSVRRLKNTKPNTSLVVKLHSNRQ